MIREMIFFKLGQKIEQSVQIIIGSSLELKS